VRRTGCCTAALDGRPVAAAAATTAPRGGTARRRNRRRRKDGRRPLRQSQRARARALLAPRASALSAHRLARRCPVARLALAPAAQRPTAPASSTRCCSCGRRMRQSWRTRRCDRRGAGLSAACATLVTRQSTQVAAGCLPWPSSSPGVVGVDGGCSVAAAAVNWHRRCFGSTFAGAVCNYAALDAARRRTAVAAAAPPTRHFAQPCSPPPRHARATPPPRRHSAPAGQDDQEDHAASRVQGLQVQAPACAEAVQALRDWRAQQAQVSWRRRDGVPRLAAWGARSARSVT
jgi:hypothetical protein